MTLRYLPEHAENSVLALELARKEATHLKYTFRTLLDIVARVDAQAKSLQLNAGKSSQ